MNREWARVSHPCARPGSFLPGCDKVRPVRQSEAGKQSTRGELLVDVLAYVESRLAAYGEETPPKAEVGWFVDKLAETLGDLGMFRLVVYDGGRLPSFAPGQRQDVIDAVSASWKRRRDETTTELSML